MDSYIDDIVLRADDADRSGLARARQTARLKSAEIMSAQIDKLKQKIIAVYGIRHYAPIYRLAMFSRPEADAQELVEHLKSAAGGRRVMLLMVLQELPKRQAEHEAAMKKIGQPPVRLKEFQRARMKTVKELSAGEVPPLCHRRRNAQSLPRNRSQPG